MKPIGITVNPASGKDIRRLTASGTVIGNRERANIAERILLALDSVASGQVLNARSVRYRKTRHRSVDAEASVNARPADGSAAHETATVMMSARGPLVLDVEETLRQAAARRFYVAPHRRGNGRQGSDDGLD